MKWLGSLIVIATVGMALTLGTPSAHARDYDCSDFSTQAEAEEYLLTGDPYNLDGDGDGVACEDLPCPCSSSPPGESGADETPPAPSEPPKLNKGAARQAARLKAFHYDMRSSAVSTVSFRGCSRRSRSRVVCMFVASGLRHHEAVTCELRVRVTGEEDLTSAHLRASCSAESTLFLTASRAAAAIRAAGAEAAEKQILLRGLERISDTAFYGVGEWTRFSPRRAECYAEYTVRLFPPNTLSVTHTAIECSPVE